MSVHAYSAILAWQRARPPRTDADKNGRFLRPSVNEWLSGNGEPSIGFWSDCRSEWRFSRALGYTPPSPAGKIANPLAAVLSGLARA
jgi:hypothetical protein